MTPSTYLADYDLFAYSYPPDLAHAILGLEHRVGCYEDIDPASFEDRLYTVESLVQDIAVRLELPPGQIADKDKP